MTSIKIVTKNKKALHDYHIFETIEAGIVLLGTEVKSIREGRISLTDSYASVNDNEVYLHNCHISAYKNAGPFNHEPLRTKKLLLHKKEIKKLIGKTKERGLTLIPLKIYFSRGRVKVELALARGKRLYDKREAMKKRDAEREMEKAMRKKNRK